MPEPKKQSSPRKTGLRRSHIRLDLALADANVQKFVSGAPKKTIYVKKAHLLNIVA